MGRVDMVTSLFLHAGLRIKHTFIYREVSTAFKDLSGVVDSSLEDGQGALLTLIS